jgi:hypothetical protein
MLIILYNMKTICFVYLCNLLPLTFRHGRFTWSF